MIERDHSENLGIDGRAVLNILNRFGMVDYIQLTWDGDR
jgi:hypothetical protein